VEKHGLYLYVFLWLAEAAYLRGSMYAGIGRLLLLLLLACDWAVDPYQGTSSLSRPLASTDSYCHSLAHREAALQSCLPALQGGPGTLPPNLDTPPPPRGRPAQEPTAPLTPLRLVYVLMSLRR
jgi:hypothetical protein